MTRLIVIALVLAACGKSEPKSEPAKPPKSEQAKGDTPKPSVEQKQDRICKRIDRDPLAKLFGIESLTRTGGGTLIKGGSEPPALLCSYYEGSKTDGGVSFGFGLKGQTTFEKADVLKRFTWEKFDGLGQEAMIGRSEKDGFFLQTIANGVLLSVDLDHPTVKGADLEKLLVDATKYVISQLPADANVELK